MTDTHPTAMAAPDRPALQGSGVPDGVALATDGLPAAAAGAGPRIRVNLPLAAGAAMVLLSVALAFAVPWLTSHDPLEIADASLSPPSSQYLLGTDQLGRDVLTRILFAARSSLSVACLSAVLAFASGTLIGLVAGYATGLVDAVMMRILDVLQAFPALLLAIALVAALGPNLPNLVLTMGLLFMPRFARVARASTLSVRERDYITAAIGLGVSRARTLVRHVLPNIAAPLIVEASLTVTIAMLTEATLSFLGLGVQPPDPTWGGMIAESTAVMALAPWLALSPGFAIVFVVVGFTLMGDGLRDALDPRG
jgi:peptide/nickel transport system permease protein